MQVKRYSKQEPLIYLWVMIPYAVVMNLLVFGPCILDSWKTFGISLGSSLVYFGLMYGSFGLVAVFVKKRFPSDEELLKRVGTLLALFYLMNLLSVQGIYFLYEKTQWIACTPRRMMEWWVTGFACMASTVLTFINEAAVGWEKWKISVNETSQLQQAYQKSRLLSLKRQINPHFLFNCFNTLSSLIYEDPDEAERFLQEMTKVFRYLLRGDDETLVSLEEELRFICAYLYLGKTRFGTALELEVDTGTEQSNKMIAPLSLLAVLENIIYRNAFSKTKPMYIRIFYTEDELRVMHTVRPKAAQDLEDALEGLDDLVNRYRFLGNLEVNIRETAGERTVHIPLIEKERMT